GMTPQLASARASAASKSSMRWTVAVSEKAASVAALPNIGSVSRDEVGIDSGSHRHGKPQRRTTMGPAPGLGSARARWQWLRSGSDVEEDRLVLALQHYLPLQLACACLLRHQRV